MNATMTYVSDLAQFLHGQGKRMSVPELVAQLNRNGLRTTYGTEYRGGRGSYRMVKATWNRLYHKLGQTAAANAVACAFVTPDGTYPY